MFKKVSFVSESTSDPERLVASHNQAEEEAPQYIFALGLALSTASSDCAHTQNRSMLIAP